MVQLLGYQLRMPAHELPHLWPEDRRDGYLLRPEIDSALSADPSVWPCADCPELAKRLFVDYSSEPFQAPNGLSVYALKPGAMEAFRDSGTRFVLVGLAASDHDANRLRAKHFIQSPTEESDRQEGFLELHGVDVCDEWLKSGLMNCGLNQADQERLRGQFGQHVNRVGLFPSEPIALKFAEKLDKLVPEHAPFMPFYVYIAHAA